MASGKTPDNDWMASAQQFQQQFVNQWTQALQNMPSMAQGVAGFDPSNPMAAIAAGTRACRSSPRKTAALLPMPGGPTPWRHFLPPLICSTPAR
jgi:hypothetical protein